jgi:2'-5' RNA ligase
MNAIRTFIAIELPEDVRQQLDQIEHEIQARAGDMARKAVRWVPASNMHLTLKFLGEVSTGNVQSLARMVQGEAARHAPFTFTVGDLGAFPNIRRPRVIWVGAHAPADLLTLQKTIEAETRRLGYPAEERPFSPHLTLGRISQNARPEEVTQVARALGEMRVGVIGHVKVDRLHLFRSDLHPSGAVYTPLHSFPLGG